MIKAGRALAFALALIGPTIIVVACTPQPRPDSPYEICNSAGCGDNVVVVIDNE